MDIIFFLLHLFFEIDAAVQLAGRLFGTTAGSPTSVSDDSMPSGLSSVFIFS